MKRIVVAGIGTDVGKTVASAVLAQALKADYWKPVQTGPEPVADRIQLQRLVPGISIHPERHHFPEPLSPHAAAELAGAHIHLDDFTVPDVDKLVVELAGGLLVPLNYRDTNLDLIKQLQMPVVLVANYYLGSINHTLLSTELLRLHDVPCLGLILNGHPTASTRNVIQSMTDLPILLDLPFMSSLTADSIALHAQNLRL